MGLALILLLPLVISSPAGGGSPFKLPCALKANGLTKFNGKYVSYKNATLHNAKEKSCQRQADRKLKNLAGTNTVLFNEVTAGFQWSFASMIASDPTNCGKEYNDLFVCKNVPTIYLNANDCLNKDNQQKCKSCKEKYPTAQSFRLDIDQEDGNIDYNWIYYSEGSEDGGWVHLDFKTCI